MFKLNLVPGLAFLLALMLALPACAQTDAGVDKISLQRTRCFGTCPVYTVSIDANGRVEFHGEQFVASQGDHTADVDADRFQQLADFARQIDFFSLQDEYRYGTSADGSRIAVSDLPSRITTLYRGEQAKSVLNYFSGPQELEAFENLIDELTGSAQWVGQQSAPSF